MWASECIRHVYTDNINIKVSKEQLSLMYEYFFFYRFYWAGPYFNFYLTNTSHCLKTTTHGLEIHFLFLYHTNQEYVNMYG